MAGKATKGQTNDALKQNGKPAESAVTNGNEPTKIDGETVNQDQADHVFQVTVKLPHPPHELPIAVSQQEQIQDLRTSIVELPDTFQYSCFHLEHNGERINDFVELSDVKGIGPGSEIKLVEDPYTEREARVHMLRVRDLIGATGDRIEPLYGLSAGVSLHDQVAPPDETEEDAGKDKKKSGDNTNASDNYDYDFDAAASVQTLIPQQGPPAPRTVKALTVSPWNPPPHYLRQRGHLMYLVLTTLEGEQFYITSHVSGFFVSKSSNSKFDPFPKTNLKDASAHSLITLIAKLSKSFDSQFKALQEYNSRRDPLVNFQITNVLPASPWIVSVQEASLSAHQLDISRTQEMWLAFGNESAEGLRDWNEEFQSTKELPKEQVQERVFRERVTNKLFADYTEASVRGAMLVARGELAPLNPTEDKHAQIFVYNNVFYSFGADGMGTFANEGGDEAARAAVGKDANGVRAVNQLDIDGLFTPGTVVVDYMGRRIVGQSIVPGIFKQREPGEHQIDYGGVEGRDVVTTNEAFVEPFAKLSKALKIKKHDVWDKEGTKHTLESSVETKGLMGTDGRKYVLDLYRLTPLDVQWLEECWADKMENEPKPKDHNYPHRMAVLRQELIDSYWRMKLSNYVSEEYEKRKSAQTNGDAEDRDKADKENKEGEDAEKKDQETIDISQFELAFNPDVYSGQKPQLDEEKEAWAKDEESVRALGTYLRETVIPNLLRDLTEGDVGFPMDGHSLSRLLHKRGVNVRYLGQIAKQASQQDARLQALVQLTIQEMVARSFKHVASSYMRSVPAVFVTSCISHLLNCLLGAGFNKDPKAELDEDLQAIYPDSDYSFAKVTPASLKAQIEEQIFIRYRYDLATDWQDNIRHLQLLREVSLKLGLQLIGKEYQFKYGAPCSKPTTNGHLTAPNGNGPSKKKKKGGLKEVSSSESLASQVTAPTTTFTPDDIANVVPLVKVSTPRSNLAEEALEAGRISLGQGQKELGQELLFEGMSLHEQIYGVLHPEVARVYHTLSMLYYQLDEKAAAVELAHKAVLVSERTLGLDSSETILSYLNLGLFEHAAGHSQLALRYVRHALDCWKLAFGDVSTHPDAITTLNNAAVMLQALRRYPASRRWFEKSHAVATHLSGAESVTVATLSFQLAQALALDHDANAAVKMMQEARNIFAAKLGKEDRNTQEAQGWLEQLTQSATNIAKHAKDVAARRALRPGGGRLGGTRVVQGPSPTTSTPAGAAAAASIGGARPAGVGGMDTPASRQQVAEDTRKLEDLVKYIQGGSGQKTPSKGAPKKRGARRGM